MNSGLGSSIIRVPEPWEILLWFKRGCGRILAIWEQRDYRFLAGLLTLGLLLRLVPLDMIPLGERQVALLAPDALVREGSSYEYLSPPGLEVLLSLIAPWRRSPRILAGILAGLNLFSVAALSLITRRYYGRTTAMLAAGFYTVSPWSILLSRRIGAVSIALSFAPILLWLLHLAVEDSRGRVWPTLFALWAVLFSISYTFLSWLFVLIFLALIYYQDWPHKIFPLLGFLLAGMISVPWLWDQFGVIGDWQRLLQLSLQDGMGTASLDPLTLLSWLHSSAVLDYLAHTDTARGSAPGMILILLDRLSAWVFICAIFAGLWQVVRSWANWRSRQEKRGYVVLLAWLLVPLVGCWIWPGDLDPKAMAAAQPAGYLLLGATLGQVIAWARSDVVSERAPWAERALLGLCVMMLAWQALAVPRYYTYVEQNGSERSYGVPYRWWEQVVQMTERELVRLDTDRLCLIYNQEEENAREMASVLRYELADWQVLFLPQSEWRKAVLLPAERPLVYLLINDPLTNDDLLTELVQGPPDAAVLLPGGEDQVALRTISGRPSGELLGRIDRRQTAQTDAGPIFVGYNVTGLNLTTFWTYGQVPSLTWGSEYRLLIILRQRGDDIGVLQSDLGLPEDHWRAGYLLAVRHRLPSLSIPELELALALDRVSDGVQSQIINRGGEPMADIITLGTVPLED